MIFSISDFLKYCSASKRGPNRTRITIGGNRITFHGNVGTPTASLELAKLVFNSVLSHPGANFTTFDICNFYLQTPLDRPEYARIKLSDIPEEFTLEYNLLPTPETAGYTSKFDAASTASHNQACSPTNFSKHVSTRQATTKAPPPQASGATSGVQSSSA